MMLYFKLFCEFFKTGLFAIGGGMATIPFLYDMSDRTGWFSYDELANMIAIGESTPGPVGVNMATYVGYITGMNDGGIWCALLGAVLATLGLVTPSVIIILVIAGFFREFRNNRLLEGALYGLRPASSGLIAAAGLSVVAMALVDVKLMQSGFSWACINESGLVLAVVIWVLSNWVKATKKLHPIVFIGFAAVAGIIFEM